MPDRSVTNILVVDDEPQILHLAVRFLRDAGFRVQYAASGGEALKKFSARPRDTSLILTDLRMPEMDGDELAARIREIHPAQRMLFMTGCPDPSRVTEVVVPKPFTAPQLVGKIEQVLATE